MDLYPPMRSPTRQGFSLVELSIVLVILGLLVGGVLSGKALIHAAELRAVPTEYDLYRTAVRSFRDKYFQLPGDMPNATQFWGSAGGSGLQIDGVCNTTFPRPTPTATCNGNGDRFLDKNMGLMSEVHPFWQHLSNAGLIPGAYAGVHGAMAGGTRFFPGVNVPKSRLSSVNFWFAQGTIPAASTTTFFAETSGNRLILGFNNGANPSISPEDAYTIDSKIDDGLPGTGVLTTTKGDGVATFCTSVAGTLTDAGATYVLTNTKKDCTLLFPRPF
ncbi:MAG: prepilin-type N-terminal cleavage/methylation domain-containing protein [Alphaproteobacteria bacterium]|nr:prepilin-type N-terminal cleavage/methylation domain-containing protein [Alphaproteobacteria bacterium]